VNCSACTRSRLPYFLAASRIVRVSASGFDAGEAFCCPIWHLFGLLPEGADGWKPKISYGSN